MQICNLGNMTIHVQVTLSIRNAKSIIWELSMAKSHIHAMVIMIYRELPLSKMIIMGNFDFFL